MDASEIGKVRNADWYHVGLLSRDLDVLTSWGQRHKVKIDTGAWLAELDENKKKGWASRPVAMILTKADQCDECTEDPDGYAKAHAAGLWQQCKERFGHHKFFAAGVAGSCGYRDSRDGGRIRVPLRIEPHGIIEPFEWLLEKAKP